MVHKRKQEISHAAMLDPLQQQFSRRKIRCCAVITLTCITAIATRRLKVACLSSKSDVAHPSRTAIFRNFWNSDPCLPYVLMGAGTRWKSSYVNIMTVTIFHKKNDFHSRSTLLAQGQETPARGSLSRTLKRRLDLLFARTILSTSPLANNTSPS